MEADSVMNTRLLVLTVAAALVGGAFAQDLPPGGGVRPVPAPMPPGMGQPPPAADGHDHEAENTEPLPSSIKGHFELVPILLPGLKAKDSAVRARAAFCLGQVGLRSTATHVKPLLEDPSKAVRYQAGIALCALEDPAGRHAAAAALSAAAEWTRYYAVHALAVLATPAEKAVLKGAREGQPDLIGAQIDEVLGEWPWPSVEPEREEPFEDINSLQDAFGAGADAAIVESDIWWHQGDYPQCVRCNETGVFLDPTWVEGYSLNGWLLWSLGINDKAIAALGRGIDANPESADAWFNMGYQYVLMKQHEVGARFLGKAAELGASAIQYRQYCHALEKAGRPGDALKAWQGMLETYPDDPIAPRHIKRLKDAGDQV